jgi:hypothetical protein
VLALLLVAVLCCGVLCSCGTSAPVQNLIKIPDIEKLDVDTAKTLLAGKGLIPKVEYEYNNDYDYDLVIRTEPAIGSEVEEDTPVTLYVCKGPSHYQLSNSIGYFSNIDGVDAFLWDDDADDGIGTKGFYCPTVENGKLHITIWLKCKSQNKIEFRDNWGTASINDTFDKTVPIEVKYDQKTIDNRGAKTEFELIIPLSDLGVQKPTNIYNKIDILVNGERKIFSASFDLNW